MGLRTAVLALLALNAVEVRSSEPYVLRDTRQNSSYAIAFGYQINMISQPFFGAPFPPKTTNATLVNADPWWTHVAYG